MFVLTCVNEERVNTMVFVQSFRNLIHKITKIFVVKSYNILIKFLNFVKSEFLFEFMGLNIIKLNIEFYQYIDLALR